MTVSERIAQLDASPTLAMAAKAAEMRAQGKDIISLSLGEPDFPTPDHIKEAAKAAIDQNFTHYGPVPGYPQLRQAIADKLKRENHLDYTPQQIIVSTGGKQAICNAILALINPGDEIIIPTPCWVSYTEMVKLAGGTSVIVKTSIRSHFKMTGKQLEDAITDKTKAVLLCSPSNPSGAVYSQAELAELADVVRRHPDILVLSDEIYEHINYCGAHHSIAEFADIKKQVVLLNGVSKAYAMTGWRIGWMAAEEWIVKACQKLQGQYTSCTCTIAMKAAEAAYTGPQDCLEEMRLAFEKRRDMMVALGREIPGWEVECSDGAFYLFPKVDALYGKHTPDGKTITGSDDLCTYLLEEACVACVAGSAFRMDECIRLSYASDEATLREAMRRIKLAVERLTI